MRIFFALIFSIVSLFANAQCCTAGCCAPGTANFGVLEKGDLLVFSFFKHNYSDQYYNGNKPLSFSYLQNDYADYAGISLSFGITNKLTVQASSGYFLTKTENFDMPVVGQQQFLGRGLADAEVYLKYNVFHAKSDRINLTVSGGAKIPTGPYKLGVDNVLLSRDVQPGTGAYSGVGILYVLWKPFKKGQGFMFNTRTDYNGVNPQGFQYGVTNTNTVSYSIKLYKDLSLMTMIRNENKDCDRINGQRMLSSSSMRIFAAPGLLLSTKHDLSVALYGDIPVYQYYAGTQLSGKYAFSIAVSKIFELHEKHPPEPEVIPNSN